MPGMLDLNRQQITTLLTLFICLVWVATAVARIWLPFPAAYILDAAMPVVIGFYFVTAATKNGATTPHE
jgi:hypothetical protein